MSNPPGGGCKKHKRGVTTYRTSGRMRVNKCKVIIQTLIQQPLNEQARKRLNDVDLLPYVNQAIKELAARRNCTRALIAAEAGV